jgi:hypothetical protein
MVTRRAPPLETTEICVVDQFGRIITERKLTSFPDAIASWLKQNVVDLARVGIESGH